VSCKHPLLNKDEEQLDWNFMDCRFRRKITGHAKEIEHKQKTSKKCKWKV
jgi:hypothetical protein